MNDSIPLVSLGRRRFLHLVALGGGAGMLAACRSGSSDDRSMASPSSPASPTTTLHRTPDTSAASAPVAGSGRRALVVVQLNGGNDALNTVVPDDGRYRDLRPTIALGDDDTVRFAGLTDRGVHASLAPLATAWDAGRLAIVEGVGFPTPDRSHFVAMDQWWTAGGLTSPAGWLGTAYDGLAGEFGPLAAVALHGGAPVLRGNVRRPVEIRRAQQFAFDERVEIDLLRSLGDGDDSDPLRLALEASYPQATDAVARFAELTETGDDDAAVPEREGDGSLAEGLRLAGELVSADDGARLVVVSAGGFDTHAGQLAGQAALLGDLAVGLEGFDRIVVGAGHHDEVVVLVVSEFGRRVAENASGGTDHGKAGLALLLGDGVLGGLHGGIDLGDLDDGDLRASVDPRTLFTACLDWLGVPVEPVLGRRFDELTLLH